MCDEHNGLGAFKDILRVTYEGVVERIEEGIASGWRLPKGIAQEFCLRKNSGEYRALCYAFIERVEFPPTWNNLDQIKFFGDIMTGERDETGVLANT